MNKFSEGELYCTKPRIYFYMAKRKKSESEPTVEGILQQAGQLSKVERLDLLAGLKALIEAIDNEEDEEDMQEKSRPECGSSGGTRIEWKIINGYGPYPYLRFRYDGKYRSYYIKGLSK
ncbi:hypothetical protein NIES4071_104640 (plasmid) [Calothrix sp. NIES-4071]|nr:hypothetical protein NIES4071_104640 [Calothrix sp. NIES-4071]BAZ64882.1 hypothetical protein NIES4105_106150 [Calothrix sp. NIES-4105]